MSPREKKREPGADKIVSDSSRSELLSVTILTNIVVRCPDLFPRLKADDKTLNRDGNVDVLQDKVPVAELAVQVKTLRPGARKFQCPSHLVRHADRTLIPFLLVCVDQQHEVAYWRQLHSAMSGYNPLRQSFVIDFTDEELVDRSFQFSPKWIELALERMRLPNELKLLKQSLLHDVDPALRGHLQQYIGVINSEFDTNWRQVKAQLFPGLWQFGVLLIEHDKSTDSWVFQIFSIRKGQKAQTVMGGPEIPPDEEADEIGRTLFGMHFQRGFRPEQDAISFVKGIVERVLSPSYAIYSDTDGRIIQIPNPEFFESRSLACLTEQVFAAYRTFPQLKSAMEGKTLNLKVALSLLEEIDVLSSNTSALQMQDVLETQSTGIDACRELLSTTELLSYTYAGDREPILMYGDQQQSDLVENLRNLLLQIVPEYQELLKTNSLQFLGDHWFDQRLMVIFVIKPRSDGTVTYDEFFVDYPGDGARVRVVLDEKFSISRLDDERSIRVENTDYRVHFATIRSAPIQLFTYTPLKAVLSRMLRDDIRDYFEEREKQARLADSHGLEG